MRGKGLMIRFRGIVIRITPAYAGKSGVWELSLAQVYNHPRLCGEKRLFSMLLAYHKGSPPPMRGKGSFVSAVVICGGITPAYAGKSDNEGGRCQLRRDHPRLCGEKPSPAKRNCYKTGSPPPMRGKVCETMKFIPSSRITPAYAGKSERDSGKSD